MRGTARLRASATGGGIPLLSVRDADGLRIRGLVFQAPTTAPCRRLLALLWVSESVDVRVVRNRFEPLGTDTIGACGYDTGLDVVGDARVFADELLIRDFQKFGVLLQDPASRVNLEDSTIRFLHAAEAPDSIDGDEFGVYALRGGAGDLPAELGPERDDGLGLPRRSWAAASSSRTLPARCVIGTRWAT